MEWDDDGFEFDDGIFEEAAKELLNAGGYSPEMLADNEACRNLIKETFRILDSGVSKGLGTKPDPDLAAALRENVFVFSGFKTHAELELAAQLITDEKGVLKPFNQFLNDAKTINAEYNHNFLRSEYNQAVQSAQIAAKWHDVQSRKNLVNLQYRTANDERVRAEHRRLHGVTLPVDDPFWNQFTPPLGWNCRCTIVEVLKDDYPESDSQGSIAIGERITEKPKDRIFRFNPGIEKAVFPKKHPYFPKGCGECGKKLLAYNPKRALCRVCDGIRKLLKRGYCKSKKDKIDNCRKYETIIKKNKEQIKAFEGLPIKNDCFLTGSLILLRKSLTDVFEHCNYANTDFLKWFSEFGSHSIKNWKYEGWGENRILKPGEKGYDPKKPNQRKHKETHCFLYYSFKLGDTKYWANIKVHKHYNNGEVLYTIEEEKPKDIIKGIPDVLKKK